MARRAQALTAWRPSRTRGGSWRGPLLPIDVINDLGFDGSEALVAQAESMAPPLAHLKRRAAVARRYRGVVAMRGLRQLPGLSIRPEGQERTASPGSTKEPEHAIATESTDD